MKEPCFCSWIVLKNQIGHNSRDEFLSSLRSLMLITSCRISHHQLIKQKLLLSYISLRVISLIFRAKKFWQFDSRANSEIHYPQIFTDSSRLSLSQTICVSMNRNTGQSTQIAESCQNQFFLVYFFIATPLSISNGQKC